MNLDPEKLLVLAVIALLVLGPDRLPRAARSLGKAVAEIRRYRDSLRSEVTGLLGEPESAVRDSLSGIPSRAKLRSELASLVGLEPGGAGGSSPVDDIGEAYEGAASDDGATRAEDPGDQVSSGGRPDDPSLN